MADTVSVHKYFAGKIPVESLGRDTIEISDLSEQEERNIDAALNDVLSVLDLQAPNIAKRFSEHRDLFIKFAQVAKAKLDERPITYPSKVGTIGVAVLFPQAVKYTATTPTDYINNTWNINLTAGTAAYILGSSTDFYRSSSTSNQKSAFIIMKDGLVEVGSTPSLQQARVISEVSQEWGIWSLSPLSELQAEENKPVYVYNTKAALPVYPDLGVKFTVMPGETRTPATIKLIGVVFYQHDLFSDLTWI